MYNGFRVVVEVPAMSEEQHSKLLDLIGAAVDDWVVQFPKRDWDEQLSGHLYYDELLPGALQIDDHVVVHSDDYLDGYTGTITKIDKEKLGQMNPYYVKLEGFTSPVPFEGSELERIDD